MTGKLDNITLLNFLIDMPKSNKKTVKAYFILNCKHPTAILDWCADCACQANFYDCPPIFTEKSDAELYMSSFEGEKIVPCTITYSLPLAVKKLKK